MSIFGPITLLLWRIFCYLNGFQDLLASFILRVESLPVMMLSIILCRLPMINDEYMKKLDHLTQLCTIFMGRSRCWRVVLVASVYCRSQPRTVFSGLCLRPQAGQRMKAFRSL